MPDPGRSREIRAVWGPGLSPIVMGSGGDDSDLDAYAELWPDPEQAAEAAERQVADRARQITDQSAGYRPPRWQVAAAGHPLSLDQVYQRLYGEEAGE